MMEHLLLDGFITGTKETTRAREVYFFSETTYNNLYNLGIVDVNELGESSFEYNPPPGAPEFSDKVAFSTTAFQGIKVYLLPGQLILEKKFHLPVSENINYILGLNNGIYWSLIEEGKKNMNLKLKIQKQVK